MRFNQCLQLGMVLLGLTLFGCSSNRVSVSIPVEKIQERMEIATTLEETNDQFFVSKALFNDLEAAAAVTLTGVFSRFLFEMPMLISFIYTLRK